MWFLTQESFDIKSLLPLVVLLSICAIIPIILSILRAKFIPVFVLEIVSGIILANIPGVREIFLTDGEMSSFMQGLYVVGLSVLLFLSGLDVDYTVLKRKKEKGSIAINRLTNILLLLVVFLSIGASFLFQKYIEKENILGISLLVLVFSSTFASVVIPEVHDEGLSHTTIGKIINNYATKAEFISIVGLSVLMISIGMTKEQKPWLLLILVISLILVYIFTRYFHFRVFTKITDGVVHFGLRLTVALLLGLIILCSASGVEYILGAFLAGAVIKFAKVSDSAIHKVETVGYGIFVPIFYILVGFKVGLVSPFSEFFMWENMKLVLMLFIVLIIVKIPFMYLCRWFPFSTSLQTMIFMACTLIVGITAEEFHIFNASFCSALIVASCLTCIIPPILFDITKRFGYSKKENDYRIVNPNHESKIEFKTK